MEDAPEPADVKDIGEESASAPPGAQRARWHRRHVRIPIVWLIVGVVAVSAGLLGWKAFEGHQREVAVNQAKDQAVGAAKSYVLLLCNINAATVDNSFSELYKTSTKEFNDAHAAQAAELRNQLIEKKVSASGSIAEVTVVSADTEKARIEMLVKESVSNTDLPAPREDRVHVSITLQKVGGQWLTSDIKLL